VPFFCKEGKRMYQALYRKYRPDTFDGVIGQDHIIKTLKNEILSDMVSHAYLFCGTRGTGKTSTAKIFAKAINCMSPENGEPCGKCEMCKAMQEGRSVNVIEIDAASNNGVENIRDIRDEVKYPPAEGKYKVYIIDEVHMLSAGAFNALLKTLEEPPAHVVFILATTDPQKVPVTILSRCQRFDFKRISSGQIASALRKYMKLEGAKADDEALMTVARLADGSMRDSLSILDQCLAFYNGENITSEKVLKISGTVDSTVLFELADGIISKNAAKCMDVIENITSDGRDIKQFTSDFMEHLRNLLVALSVDEPETLIDMSDENIAKLKEQAKKLSSDELIYLIKIFSQLSNDMRYASNQRILLEVEIIKLCSNTVKNDTDYIAARLSELERKIKSGVVLSQSGEKTKSEKKKVTPKPRQKAVPDDIKQVIGDWKNIASKFEEPSTRALLLNTSAVYEDDGRITIVCDDGAMADILKNKVDLIKNVLEEKYKKAFQIKIANRTEYEDWEKLMGIAESENDGNQEIEQLQSKFPDADFE
jgi:DNA polymerase-3 subunit gamma/tau